jgi:predicted nuclease of predicted toxin-antitoxin system
MLLFDECIPAEVICALKTLEVASTDVRALGGHRTADKKLVAVAKKLSAIFVTFDLDFTTAPLLEAMAREGVCVVMIRRPKGADLAQIAEIILRHMRTWSALCGDEPTIISCNHRQSRARPVASLPHVRRQS